MNTDPLNSCACSACNDANHDTLPATHNPAGLDTLRFRAGTHSSFKASMLRALSTAGPLRALSTREDDDPGIALIDAWATVLDVLTFYQERIVQEGYLRTADERLSLVELARHISYRPKPGVAAQTWLAFNMDESAGAPKAANVPAGTKVQSIPGQDEKPQLFETIEPITARTAFNALKPLQRRAPLLGKGSTNLYLQGANVQVQIGDVIAIVGEERLDFSGSENWDIRTIAAVEIDAHADRTRIFWREGLGHDDPLIYPGSKAKVYVFRQRASLFGFNAPDFRLFGKDQQANFNGTNNVNSPNWPGFRLIPDSGTTLYTDTVYPKFVSDSWIALQTPEYTELYRIIKNGTEAKTAYSLSAKVSKLELDSGENFSKFNDRKTVVLGQSELLPLAEMPLLSPVFGQKIELEGFEGTLQIGQKIILSGEPALYLKVTPRKVVIKKGSQENEVSLPLTFIPKSGQSAQLKAGETLEIAGAPETLDNNLLRWPLVRNGKSGHVDALESDFEVWTPAPETPANPLTDKILQSESHIIEQLDGNTITLQDKLKGVYLRSSLRINANVAEATHGESKMEVLGSGDGARIFQKFKLKQKPLTYTLADTSSGVKSTLQIRVNDLLWEEVPSFYGRGPLERIFITLTDDDGSVSVQFGDGITGARLPSGTENVRAYYRIGIGLEALLKANQLSMLLSPQLGLKSVSNPEAPFGAENPEAIEAIRSNAPLTVLGLDRIVSVPDYQFFANAFAGIGKARADLLWNDAERILHLTVASAAAGAVDDEVQKKLKNAINAARHALFPVQINSFTPVTFGLKAKIKTAAEYLPEKVLEQVKDALEAAYSFEQRNFAQPVSASEIIAIMQGIEGVVAVDLDELGGKNPFGTQLFKLKAAAARWDTGQILPAELLLIDPAQITLSLWNNEN
jgi:hypothetical protein